MTNYILLWSYLWKTEYSILLPNFEMHKLENKIDLTFSSSTKGVIILELSCCMQVLWPTCFLGIPLQHLVLQGCGLDLVPL